MRLHWTQELYGTGVQLLDQQHQELFSRINALMDKIETNADVSDIQEVITYLGQYAVTHFACEERIMEERKCASACANRSAHAQFLGAYAQLKIQFDKEGPSPAFIEKLKGMLFGWLRSHIMGIDSTLKDKKAP